MIGHLERRSRTSVRYAFRRYVNISAQIRELSVPQLDGITSAEDYRVKLLDNFKRIGIYGMENSSILEENYYPMLSSNHPLKDEDIDNLWELSGMLLRSYSIDYLDLPMFYMQSERLLQDAEQKENDKEIIRALDGMVNAASVMMYMTQRLYPASNICFRYRDIGLDAAYRILTYLSPELFVTLPDEDTKKLVLRNARYICSLFDRRDCPGNFDINESDLSCIRQSLSLADQTFYKNQVPTFDWDYHLFRTYHNAMILTERANANGYTKTQLMEIYGYSLKMGELWESSCNPELKSLSTAATIQLYQCRSAFLAGYFSLKDYRLTLRRLILSRDTTDFSTPSVLINMLAPLEFILSFKDDSPTRTDEAFLSSYYDELISYVYHIPKRGSFSLMLTFLTDLLAYYIKIPGGIGFEEMCLKLMAALHPPTYVHSLSVASFSTFLATHLLRLRPELFIGVCDCATIDDVKLHKQKIIGTLRHSALLHDVGKLYVIETILTYGRPLFDMERELIQSHPSVGAHLLSLHRETAPYADAALYHHIWYNRQGGYPEISDDRPAQNNILIDILACADCLDAATDKVGRSYKPGKALNHFIEELRSQSGTRYAPYLIELMDDETVRHDVQTLLAIGRNENYRVTYHVLRSL